MEWVETTGKTIEEAKDIALDQLGVDEQEAEFEILDQPRVGLFGRVRSEARLRARVKPTAPRPKEDRRDRRRRERPAEPAGSPVDTEAGLVAVSTGDTAPAGPPGSHPGEQRRQSTGSAERLPAGGGSGPAAETESRSRPERNREREPAVEVELVEQGRIGQEFLEGLLRQMGLAAAIQVTQPDDETVDVNLSGDGLGILIGPKGATLLALQDLTRTVVQRRTAAANGRLQVDVGGYRQKRTEALVRFSEKVAADVQASGQRMPLEPMSAADRRIVHDAISKLDRVSTVSEGEESLRHVVILPLGS